MWHNLFLLFRWGGPTDLLPLGFTNITLQDISPINSCERAYYYLGLFLGVHNVGGGSYARGDGGGGGHAGGGGDAGGQVRLAGEALDADPVPLRDILVLQRGVVALQTKISCDTKFWTDMQIAEWRSRPEQGRLAGGPEPVLMSGSSLDEKELFKHW